MHISDIALISAASTVVITAFVISRLPTSAFRRGALRAISAPSFLLLAVLACIVIYLLPIVAAPNDAEVELALRVALGVGLVWLGIRVFTSVVFNVYFRSVRGIVVPDIIAWLTNKILYVIAFIIYLNQSQGYSVGDLIITTAILLIVMGIAFQRPLSGFVGDFATSTALEFRVGDLLRVGEVHGIVADIDWRWVSLYRDRGERITLPLQAIVQHAFFWRRPSRGVYPMSVDISVNSALAPGMVQRALLDTVASLDTVVAEPKPSIMLRGIRDGLHLCAVEFYVTDYSQERALQHQILAQMWYKLKRTGIDNPFYASSGMVLPADAEQQARAVMFIWRQLQQQTLLSPLSEAELKELAGRAKCGLYGQHEHVFSQGDSGDSLFVIKTGVVEIQIVSDSVSGKRRTVAELGVNELFGEMSLLTGARRSATAVIKQECELIEIDKGAFQVILENNPAIMEQLSKLVAERQGITQKIKLEEASSDVEDYKKDLISKIKKYFRL